MPLRAFLFFLLYETLNWMFEEIGRNALTGIFVFSTLPQEWRTMEASDQSQCPYGHFCFFYEVARGEHGDYDRVVAMPLRAFLFFLPLLYPNICGRAFSFLPRPPHIPLASNSPS